MLPGSFDENTAHIAVMQEVHGAFCSSLLYSPECSLMINDLCSKRLHQLHNRRRTVDFHLAGTA